MKITTFCTLTIALCLAACGKQEAPEQAASEQAAAPAAEAAVEGPKFDQDFIDHMHAHAEQLDELMFALADDDLEGAMTPAYWLSRHDAVAGVPDEWQHFIAGMREAASAVESAANIEAAKLAAEQISAQCQGCHEAAGVSHLDSAG